MENGLRNKRISQKRRAFHVRKSTRGTKEKPRLSVFRSNRHLFAQIIDDESSTTIAAVGTLSKELRKEKMKRKQQAAFLGQKIAELAKEKNVTKIVFDRGRFKYHGLIAELALAARKAGLQF